MTAILGINAFHAGASAALVVDGKPVAAIAEERLNRVKYYAGFPTKAVLKCLEIGGITFSDLTAVTIGRDSSANLGKKLSYAIQNPGKLLNLLKIKKRKAKSLDDLKPLLIEMCGAEESDLKFQQYNIEHHLAHIASAYYISPWDDCAAISIDGSGDFVTCMMASCTNDQIEVKHRVHVPHSLGSLYSMVGEFIGYDKYGDEGKVMGLAPCGRDRYVEEIRKMIKVKDKGLELDHKYFVPFGASQGFSIQDDGTVNLQRHYSDLMIEKFGTPRVRNEEITERDEDLAFGLQKAFEEVYLHLVNELHKLVPNDRVALAGGCALNSVANGMIFDKTPFKETCIQPASGDDGLALGAALYVSNAILKEKKRFVMKDAYLGPGFSDDEVETALRNANVPFERLNRDDLLNKTSDEIVAGNVVGWFQGRMEWGPRALGNRSILAHPGLPNMKDTLNARIKHRESFRPFAPAVLAERQSEIFEQEHPSPFMLHVYKIRPEWRERLAAVNHVDNTGRLQSVSREENSLYYDLIAQFGDKTGIPVIVNTSFNENEPVVCTPEEAIDCYLRTKMDTLAIGSFFCKKSLSTN